MIAGTYPPFSLLVLDGALGWALFGLLWTLAVVGIVTRCLRYGHTIWHLCVLAGSALHYFGVLFYVIPAGG